MTAATQTKSRRSDAEIAADYEKKAAEIRKKLARRSAAKGSAHVRRMFTTAKALHKIASDTTTPKALADNCLILASDLEVEADRQVGRSRIDS